MKIKKVDTKKLKKMTLLDWILAATLITSGVVVYLADTFGLLDVQASQDINKNLNNNENKTIVTNKAPEGYYTYGSDNVIRVVTDIQPAIKLVDPITGITSYVAPEGYMLVGDMAYKYASESVPAQEIITNQK